MLSHQAISISRCTDEADGRHLPFSGRCRQILGRSDSEAAGVSAGVSAMNGDRRAFRMARAGHFFNAGDYFSPLNQREPEGAVGGDVNSIDRVRGQYCRSAFTPA